MGPFNTVTVEHLLPNLGTVQGRRWHTKSLEVQWGERYEITKDGRLVRTDDESNFPEQVDFSGILEFHGYVDVETRDRWVSFEALFDQGNLLELILSKEIIDKCPSCHGSGIAVYAITCYTRQLDMRPDIFKVTERNWDLWYNHGLWDYEDGGPWFDTIAQSLEPTKYMARICRRCVVEVPK